MRVRQRGACVLGMLWATVAMAQIGAPRSDVDAVFSAWSGTDRPGCALAVAQAGEIVYAHGYGMANLESATPIRPESIFDVGSVSKQFTAMAVIMLSLDGRLSLDDDIRKYLPELPDYGDKITIRHLLNHTSGLRNYTDLFDLAGVPEVSLTTSRDALGLIARQTGVNFHPGDEFLYSDTNYFLAGEIVYRVTGQSLRQFSAERIFNPLHMTHTHINDNPRELVVGRASGYEPVGAAYQNYMSNFEQVGDGSVMTTVLDLTRWAQNLQTASVGGQAAVNLLTQPGLLNNGVKTAYGMGLFIDEYRGLKWYHHDGEWVGYRAAISSFPSENFHVVVTCNTLGDLDPMSLALKVSDLYLADRLATMPVTAPSAAASFAGLFWSPKRGTVRRFEESEGRLWLGHAKTGAPLQLVGPNAYRSQGETASTYAFTEHPAPGAGQLLSSTFGTTFEYFRIPESAPDVQSIEELAGTYTTTDLPNDWVLVAEGGRLLRRAPYAHDTELVPVFADTFIGSLSEGDFLIHFARDAQNQVTGFLVSGEMLRPVFVARAPGR